MDEQWVPPGPRWALALSAGPAARELGEAEADAGYPPPVATDALDVTLVPIDPWDDGGYVVDGINRVVFPLRTEFLPPPAEPVELRADDAADDAVASLQALAEDPQWSLLDIGGSQKVARATAGDGNTRRTVLVYTDVDDALGGARLSGGTGEILDSVRGTESRACTQAARWLAESEDR
uniref:hypothetical protein n=1 Tax=Amycolatopsis sp. CA-096443 TaxID=3239919 RepID=UPI003F4973E7